MYKLLFLLLLLMTPVVNAQELSPGSYTVKYGGIYKAMTSETHRFFESQWKGQEEEAYLSGEISFGTYARRQRRIDSFLEDWKYGPPWWTRSWWQSLPPNKGGAPLNHSIRICYGRTYKIIDTPLFSFSNSLSFKWKHLEATVDFDAKRPIIFGRSEPPKTGWQFKLSPDISISTKELWKQSVGVVRTIGFFVSMIRTVKTIPVLSVALAVQYRPLRGSISCEVQIRMLQW